MFFKIVLRSLATGKARFVCAALGIAASVGAVSFVTSLSATNAEQAPRLAAEAARPWKSWRIDGDLGLRRRGGKEHRERTGGTTGAEQRAPAPVGGFKLPLVASTIDVRPGGRVLQGPPMRCVIAAAPGENPYDSVTLAEGRWVDMASSVPEVVCTYDALKRFGRGPFARIGDDVKFVGRAGVMTAKLVGFLKGRRLPPGFPGVFANSSAFAVFSNEKKAYISLWKDVVRGPGVMTASSASVVSAYKADESRRMDYARPLMLVAAVLTALALLVNSLLLSVEANRGSIAILRTVGLTRFGAVGFVAVECLLATLAGIAAGLVCSTGALHLYTAMDPVSFPAGVRLDTRSMLIASVSAFPVAFLAVLFALRSTLAVRPLDTSAVRAKTRRSGMAIAFAFGFGSFVAVEIWGASLMRGFVPSREWPDAIVSLLPAGTDSFDIEKLKDVKGVKRITELLPLQVEMPRLAGADEKETRGYRPNALFLAAGWLPGFRFVEGDRASAVKALEEEGACVISLMMSRARNLHKGDFLEVILAGRGGGAGVKLPIAGVVDVNWHMVTSRGLVRGMNGAPGMTDGPVFASFDTVESLDPRPAPHVPMTHLWVEYEKEFMETNGVFEAGRAVEREIAQKLGNPADFTVRLHARDEIADGTLAHGSKLIGQVARVPFVFLAILAIGFVAMLVAEADAKKHEYEVLRAVGATRSQLVGRLVGAALATALRGIVISLPFGALAGWGFAVKTASVWPGMPRYFEVPWRLVAEGAAGGVLLALLVAVPVSMWIVTRGARR